PASTGRDRSSRKAVTRIDHTNRGILCSVMPGARMLKIVVMKLMAPRIEDAPARWSEKIAMSTAAPGWPTALDSGGERGQPGAAPPPAKGEPRSRREGGGSRPKATVFLPREAPSR